MRYVIFPGDENGTHLLGGKAGALADLSRAGFSVPAWMVVSPEALNASLGPAGHRALSSGADPSSLGAALASLTLPPDLMRELAAALARLCPNGERVAVRSSALEEDGTRHSFAGQLESILSVEPGDVPATLIAVWRSAFGRRALAYRRERGLRLPGPSPAVLIQHMVSATRAGVAFGADPVSARRGIVVVSAVHGLGTSLVSGEAAADTYRVDREGRIVSHEIAEKRLLHRPAPGAPGGFLPEPVAPPAVMEPVLTDEEVRRVADLARQAGRQFGRPQDIEWAFQGTTLLLLQSRPITALAAMSDPDGCLRLWDNSNIAESYAGVTTPLTFSFVRHAYEGVYRQFCRILGVPEPTIAAHAETFRCMIGLIRGRMYYNLLNWYRVLALLPGFASNRRFMEQMMGVREGIPEAALAEQAPPGWHQRAADGLRLLRTTVGLALNLLRLPQRIRRFSRRLDRAVAPGRLPVEELRPDELTVTYRTLERQLLTRWDAPLLNDLFTMIAFGLLRRLAARWCRDPHGILVNDLLAGEQGLISVEPARQIREMARSAAADPEFVRLLSEGSLPELRETIDRRPDFLRRYRAYLEAFGHRCFGELKLESLTLHDDPLPLLRSIGQAARFPSPDDRPAAGAPPATRAAAEAEVRRGLAGRPLRRILFRRVLRQARVLVRDREALRLDRTRLFARVRAIFLQFGRQLCALDILDSPRDVFYLEVDEVLGCAEGTATTTNLRGLVALRKAEYRNYRTAAPPPDRFETRGLVAQGQFGARAGGPQNAPGPDRRQGLGCSRGVVRGPVRIVADPHRHRLQPGEILVAPRTDPGWITLYPSAAGLLVEQGSLLSHAAIVARELGIPAVTSLPGLMGWLRDGDWVEFDGATGSVRRLAPGEAEVGHAR